MYSCLQVAAACVPPPINANDVHRHALATWEASRTAATEANRWSIFAVTGTMNGTWITASGKLFSKAFVAAIRPRQFRESVRNEMINHTDGKSRKPQPLCKASGCRMAWHTAGRRRSGS